MKIKFLLCMALAISLFSCGKDDEPWNDDANDLSNNSSVVINADGTTSTGVQFSMLDGTTFFLDYIKYQIVDSHLKIVGYDHTEIADNVRPYAYVTLNGTRYNTRAIDDPHGCSMSRLSIPSTVQSIYLRSWENLRQLSIPNSVTSLDIQNCHILSELTISNSVKWLSIACCDSLTELTIPNSVISLSIDHCDSLTELTIPSSITNFKTYCTIGWCPNLKKLVLPEKIDYFRCEWVNPFHSTDIYMGECEDLSDPRYYMGYTKPLTFHVKSDCVEEMTRKLNPYGLDNIIVVGDYSSSIK